MVVGDYVQFTVENDNDIYSYQVPPQGTKGLIKSLGFQRAFQMLFGADVPYHLVAFENGMEIDVYEHDLKVVNNKLTDLVN